MLAAGLGLAGLGLVGLGFCIAGALRLRRETPPPEVVAARLKRLFALNMGSLALGMAGAALVLAGLLT